MTEKKPNNKPDIDDPTRYGGYSELRMCYAVISPNATNIHRRDQGGIHVTAGNLNENNDANACYHLVKDVLCGLIRSKNQKFVERQARLLHINSLKDEAKKNNQEVKLHPISRCKLHDKDVRQAMLHPIGPPPHIVHPPLGMVVEKKKSKASVTDKKSSVTKPKIMKKFPASSAAAAAAASSSSTAVVSASSAAAAYFGASIGSFANIALPNLLEMDAKQHRKEEKKIEKEKAAIKKKKSEAEKKQKEEEEKARLEKEEEEEDSSSEDEEEEQVEYRHLTKEGVAEMLRKKAVLAAAAIASASASPLEKPAAAATYIKPITTKIPITASNIPAVLNMVQNAATLELAVPKKDDDGLSDFYLEEEEEVKKKDNSTPAAAAAAAAASPSVLGKGKGKRKENKRNLPANWWLSPPIDDTKEPTKAKLYQSKVMPAGWAKWNAGLDNSHAKNWKLSYPNSNTKSDEDRSLLYMRNVIVSPDLDVNKWSERQANALADMVAAEDDPYDLINKAFDLIGMPKPSRESRFHAAAKEFKRGYAAFIKSDDDDDVREKIPNLAEAIKLIQDGHLGVIRQLFYNFGKSVDPSVSQGRNSIRLFFERSVRINNYESFYNATRYWIDFCPSYNIAWMMFLRLFNPIKSDAIAMHDNLNWDRMRKELQKILGEMRMHLSDMAEFLEEITRFYETMRHLSIKDKGDLDALELDFVTTYVPKKTITIDFSINIKNILASKGKGKGKYVGNDILCNLPIKRSIHNLDFNENVFSLLPGAIDIAVGQQQQEQEQERDDDDDDDDDDDVISVEDNDDDDLIEVFIYEDEAYFHSKEWHWGSILLRRGIYKLDKKESLRIMKNPKSVRLQMRFSLDKTKKKRIYAAEQQPLSQFSYSFDPVIELERVDKDETYDISVISNTFDGITLDEKAN